MKLPLIKASRKLRYTEWDGVVVAIVVMLTVAVIVICAIIIARAYASMPAACRQNDKSMDCLAARVEQCVADERFTRQECIQLVGRQR